VAGRPGVLDYNPGLRRLLSFLPGGWLPLATVAAILAVNAAGIGGILVVRRGAIEQADKLFQLEIAERARALESRLASSRADLAFLVASPALVTLERDLLSEDPREARWRRMAVEGALLLFLRGHPETRSLVVYGNQGAPLVAAGRRGGVPVLWLPSRVPAGVTQASDASSRVVLARFDIAGLEGSGKDAAALEASLDPLLLLKDRAAGDWRGDACGLSDRRENLLAGGSDTPSGEPDAGDPARASALVHTEGWSAEAPWTLSCLRTSAASLSILEPVAARYRTSLVLILAIMGLAVVLGSFAIQQERRSQMLEARAREDARVRELERQLFHAERLSTVGRLAAGMAHEINNPLEGISNYLRLAREALERGDADGVKRRLDSVQEGLDRAAGIVRRVLVHAEPAASPRARVDLNAVISEAAAFVRSRSEFAAIRFVMDLDPAMPAVRGDAVTLGQLFLNLVINACEAQPSGGEVCLSTRALEDGSAAAEVADHGPGVPSEERARVFEPFYTTKESTGLGLSICHAIAQQHQAHLSVSDRPGGGAVFRIVLPPPAARPDCAIAEVRHA
jgi:signal transduction histidine kinase